MRIKYIKNKNIRELSTKKKKQLYYICYRCQKKYSRWNRIEWDDIKFYTFMEQIMNDKRYYIMYIPSKFSRDKNNINKVLVYCRYPDENIEIVTYGFICPIFMYWSNLKILDKMLRKKFPNKKIYVKILINDKWGKKIFLKFGYQISTQKEKKYITFIRDKIFNVEF